MKVFVKTIKHLFKTSYIRITLINKFLTFPQFSKSLLLLKLQKKKYQSKYQEKMSSLAKKSKSYTLSYRVYKPLPIDFSNIKILKVNSKVVFLNRWMNI